MGKHLPLPGDGGSVPIQGEGGTGGSRAWSLLLSGGGWLQRSCEGFPPPVRSAEWPRVWAVEHNHTPGTDFQPRDEMWAHGVVVSLPSLPADCALVGTCCLDRCVPSGNAALVITIQPTSEGARAQLLCVSRQIILLPGEGGMKGLHSAPPLTGSELPPLPSRGDGGRDLRWGRVSAGAASAVCGRLGRRAVGAGLPRAACWLRGAGCSLFLIPKGMVLTQFCCVLLAGCAALHCIWRAATGAGLHSCPCGLTWAAVGWRHAGKRPCGAAFVHEHKGVGERSFPQPWV